MKKSMKSFVTILSMGLVLIAFIVITLFITHYQMKDDRGQIIAEDIAHLALIFKRIEDTAHISDFSAQKNPINFLTIKKDGFVGSQIGSMNLIYPERWDGPYTQRNPSIEGIVYQILRTQHGYFILPGDGVKLPNGKIVGTDIPTDFEADIPAYMQNPQMLMFEGKALAARLIMHSYEIQPSMEQEIVAEEMI